MWFDGESCLLDAKFMWNNILVELMSFSVQNSEIIRQLTDYGFKKSSYLIN